MRRLWYPRHAVAAALAGALAAPIAAAAVALPGQPPMGAPPPPSTEIASSALVVQGVAGSAATCAAGGGNGCTFGYSLALTPVLLSSSPAVANEGETLTITGHSLSLTAADNIVSVGGRPCEVLTVENDGTFTPICPGRVRSRCARACC